MYERFTDRAKKIMQLANHDAQRFNHDRIDTQHVLVGMLKEGEGVAAAVLKNLDVDLLAVRREIEKLAPPGPEGATPGRMELTLLAERVVQNARKEAAELHHNYVGTEHLLMGLARESEGIAAQVLTRLGLKLEDVRAEVLDLLGHGPGHPP